jgi:hypothetical protein
MASRVSTFIPIVSAGHIFPSQSVSTRRRSRSCSSWATVDFPFPRAIRDVLLEEHWPRNFVGWHIRDGLHSEFRNDVDLEHAPG